MHPSEIDRIAQRLAAGQHEMVARWQLAARGVNDQAILHRCRSGRWRKRRTGVYQLGTGRLTRRAQWMRDVLACGPDAGLAGTSALQLLGALRENSRRTVVVTSKRGRRPPRGIDLRTSRNVEFITWDGIPTTTLERALADAAPDLDDEQLEAAYEKAIVKCGASPDLIPRTNRRLNQLIKDHRFCTALTDSELENLFRRILKKHGLPQPESNQPVWTGERTVYPDFLFREAGVAVEIEGWHVHRDQHEADTLRKADMSAIGLIVIEFTKLMLVRHPLKVVRALQPFLGPAGGGTPP